MAQLFINGEIAMETIVDTDSDVGIFNNWVVPGLIACGPYPGLDGINYCSDDEVLETMNKFKDAGITTIISLQEETTPHDGTVGEVNPEFKWNFPQYKSYSLYAKDMFKYLHFPITDNSIPEFDVFIANITKILELLMTGERVFIHCAGGHGRTGMYTTVLLFILKKMDCNVALKLNQKLHNSRKMLDRRAKKPPPSPSTSGQKAFVRNVCKKLMLKGEHALIIQKPDISYLAAIIAAVFKFNIDDVKKVIDSSN